MPIPNLKRKFSETDRSVSPPAVKRKHSENEAAATTSQDQGQDQISAQSNLLRIYSWNVNGINPFLQKQLNFAGKLNPSSTSLNPLRTFLKRHSWPHFLCLQEVKISPRDEATQRRLEQAANQGASVSAAVSNHADSPDVLATKQDLDEGYTYTAHFSLPRDKFNATGFGGKVHGVATLIRNDICSSPSSNEATQTESKSVGNGISTYKPDFDLEGRVLIHTLPEPYNITIINGYWVNGTSNPYRNPTTGIVQGTRHDHKLRFHAEMLSLAKNLMGTGQTEKKKHVVLVGDMNVARSRVDGHPNLRTSPYQHVKNRADFNAKFFTDAEGLQGVDVFREIHGEERKYTYHPRGRRWGNSCDRVDNIIVNRELWETGAIASTDICDNPCDRGHSDHVPLWIAVNMNILMSYSEDVHH